MKLLVNMDEIAEKLLSASTFDYLYNKMPSKEALEICKAQAELTLKEVEELFLKEKVSVWREDKGLRTSEHYVIVKSEWETLKQGKLA